MKPSLGGTAPFLFCVWRDGARGGQNAPRGVRAFGRRVAFGVAFGALEASLKLAKGFFTRLASDKL